MKRLATVFLLAGAAACALAQGTGGSSRSRDERRDGRGDSRSIVDQVERRADPGLRPHVMAAFAVLLERELPSIPVPAAAAGAVRDFVREVRDYATLDDRRVRERTGLAPRTVHAVVDLQRDLNANAEYAAELSGSANDVLARWRKLRELLDEPSRNRIEAIYAAALNDPAGVIGHK